MTIDFNAALGTGTADDEGSRSRTAYIVDQFPALPDFKGQVAAFRAGLAWVDDAIAEMTAEATALVVQDEATNVTAVEMAGQGKKLWKRIEEIRKRATAEPNDFIKAVNGLAKSYQTRFEQVENGLKSKISQYQSRIELERRKAEELARKAALELQAKLDAEAKKAGVESVKIEAPVIPKQETVTRTQDGSSYQVKSWVFEVEDETRVPREYLVVDGKKLRDAVGAGVRQIPGVRIFEQTETRIRT